eukprot:CAMPEP_0172732298 /NCGR_PEP_ID=MMETSP1074-20121228/104005_1 /TAXON_ID=2916 /ORGANISM="Ceratium fusus, Strain PA161109" /LENGTH=83 /DNA_ID=CAMNT_0013560563 /DNA_START=379 /DNA_END=630 /DNA_ORIENTATION=-
MPELISNDAAKSKRRLAGMPMRTSMQTSKYMAIFTHSGPTAKMYVRKMASWRMMCMGGVVVFHEAKRAQALHPKGLSMMTIVQ